MDLSDIHIAVVVGRERSVSAAAVRLGFAPGTVSKAIGRLERQLKVQLFERLARGMRPTEIGAAFLERAQGMDMASEDLYAQMRDLRQARAGTLRVGVGYGIPDNCVVPVMTQLVEQGVRVQLAGGMTDSLRRDVAAGELEFALIGLFKPPGEGLAWESLADDPMQPMAPKGHPLALPRRAVPWRELAQARWIVTGRQTSTFTEYQRNFEARGLQAPEPAVLSLSSLLGGELARTTKSLVLMPRSALRDPSSRAAAFARVQPVGGWQSERSIGLVYRDGGYLGPPAQQAMSLLRKRLRKLD